MGRTEDRAGFTDDVRMRLVEQDLDRHGQQFDALLAELAKMRQDFATEMAALRKDSTAEATALRRLFTGLLVTLAASAITFALTNALQGA